MYKEYFCQTGEIAGAGLDVMIPEPLPPNHEMLALDNVVLTPHIGTATMETKLKMIQMTVQNILSGLQNATMQARIC